jgi:hypothetical protein
MISDPTTVIRLKRGQKEKIESAMSDAMAQLEIEDTEAEELRKKASRGPAGDTKLTAAGACLEAHRHQGLFQQVITGRQNRYVKYGCPGFNGQSGYHVLRRKLRRKAFSSVELNTVCWERRVEPGDSCGYCLESV